MEVQGGRFSASRKTTGNDMMVDCQEYTYAEWSDQK